MNKDPNESGVYRPSSLMHRNASIYAAILAKRKKPFYS